MNADCLGSTARTLAEPSLLLGRSTTQSPVAGRSIASTSWKRDARYGVMLIVDPSDDDAIAMHRSHSRWNVAMCRKGVERECERGVPAECT